MNLPSIEIVCKDVLGALKYKMIEREMGRARKTDEKRGKERKKEDERKLNLGLTEFQRRAREGLAGASGTENAREGGNHGDLA